MVETFSYALSLGAKAVGSQVLKTSVTPRVTTLECRALFQGALGSHSLEQSSRILSASGESLYFSETDTSGEKHTFEVTFDTRSGVVQATRQLGTQLERTEVPYLRPYSDPLGLLHIIRGLGHGSALRARVPLLGKDVLVESLGEWPLETAQGERLTYGYALRPGPAYIYVDAEPPHALVRLLQPTQYGHVEAFLVRTVQEDGTLSAAKEPAKERSGKRRRRGGRRRRRVEK